MRLSAQSAGLLAAAVTVVIWTSFIVISRASASHTLTPLDIAFVRIVGAACVLMPVGAWLVRSKGLKGWLGVSPLSFRVTAQVGLFGGSLFAVLAYSGFFLAPASHASVLLPGSLPLWTTLIAAVLLGTRISRAGAVALMLILAGDLFVGGVSLLKAFQGGDVWKGDLLFMSAALCWSTYGVLVRRHNLDPVQATVALIVFAFVTYVPGYAVLAYTGVVTSHLAQAPAGEVIFQTLFQGLGSVVISGIAFNKMIQHYGPVRSTMITALVPGLSALGAVVFLGEQMSWNLMAGLALVTVGIVIGVRGVASLPRQNTRVPA